MASMDGRGTQGAMEHIFLSYKKGDRARAAQIVAGLEAEGFAVWWDQHLRAGEHWRETLTERLTAASCVIVLWSELSVGSEGRFVIDEARRAQRRGVYIPVRLDDVEPPLGFGEMQSVKLIGWRGDPQAPAFRALVDTVRPMVAPGGPPSPPAAIAAPSRRRIDRRLVLGGVAIAGAGGVALALASRDVRRAIGLAPPPNTAVSVAVLPFRNLSGDPRQDYLGDGVSEELRNALSRLGAIRVAARTSSEAFRDARGDIAKIAAGLDVAYVLDGSVRVAADKLRVTAQLVDAKTGFERWSDSFDRVLTDVIAVQTDIATSVAEALRGRLQATEAALVAKPSTSAPAAYDALLQGSQIYRQAGGEADYRRAVQLFETALAADPRCADAYVMKAAALRVLAGQFEPAARVRSTSEQAIAAAQRAVALAPNSGYAQSVLGYALLYGRLDFASARGPYERSIQLSPNDARVIGGYGQFQAATGRADLSLTTLARAVHLDPINPNVYRAQAQALMAARRYAEAAQAMRHALEVNPRMGGAHALLGEARLLQGDAAGAIAEYRVEPSSLSRLKGLSMALRQAGDAAGATAAFRELVETEGDSAAYQQAQVQAQWRDADAAFAALDRAFAVTDSGLTSLGVDPLLEPIRRDARYPGVLRRLGLA